VNKRIAVITLVIVLTLVNWSIYKKEDQLAHGDIVYLRLAPADPRSLMQGDYMRLRFDMSRSVHNALPKDEDNKRWRQQVNAKDGYAVVTLNEQRIAEFKSIYTDQQSLAENEILLRYRVRDGKVKFATNAFFFQEGHAKIYESAVYGQFRVAEDGDLLLTAMYDKDLNKLKPTDAVSQADKRNGL